jgi:hypothetical protein
MEGITDLPPLKECSLCGGFKEKMHRHYKGRSYCDKCYPYLFKKIECTVCLDIKRIYRYENPPICQQCQIEASPCLRCGKQEYKLGKLTEFGPVCNSCAKYYCDQKTCCECGKKSLRVARRLQYGINDPICNKCFRDNHFETCSHCKQRHPPFQYDLDRNMVCKECATKPDKSCTDCGAIVPAGCIGNKCKACCGLITLNRRIKLNKVGLQKSVAELYQEYGVWLTAKTGSQVASRKIIADYKIFTFLDGWVVSTGELPNYQSYIESLTVSVTRKHLLATTFLQEKGVITVCNTLKAETGDLDTIDRIVSSLSDQSPLYPYLNGYYSLLLQRNHNGKANARACRLALTPAVKMLLLGEFQSKILPDNTLLRQYLWLHYGQRAAITGFVNYLKKTCHIDIQMPAAEDFLFKRPRQSKYRIQQKLIEIIRSKDFGRDDLLEVCLNYFHHIALPEELTTLVSYLPNPKTALVNLKLGGKVFFVPNLSEI